MGVENIVKCGLRLPANTECLARKSKLLVLAVA